MCLSSIYQAGIVNYSRYSLHSWIFICSFSHTLKNILYLGGSNIPRCWDIVLLIGLKCLMYRCVCTCDSCTCICVVYICVHVCMWMCLSLSPLYLFYFWERVSYWIWIMSHSSERGWPVNPLYTFLHTFRTKVTGRYYCGQICVWVVRIWTQVCAHV